MIKFCLLWLNLFADLLAFDRMLPRKAPSWSNQRRQLFSSKPKPLFATSKSPQPIGLAIGTDRTYVQYAGCRRGHPFNSSSRALASLRSAVCRPFSTIRAASAAAG